MAVAAALGVATSKPAESATASFNELNRSIEKMSLEVRRPSDWTDTSAEEGYGSMVSAAEAEANAGGQKVE